MSDEPSETTGEPSSRATGEPSEGTPGNPSGVTAEEPSSAASGAPSEGTNDAAEPSVDEVAVEALRADEYVGPVVERHGPLSIEPAADPFERLVVSILRQQVSMASAAAIRERLFEAVEVTPEGLLAADPSVLRDAGLSRQKTRYVRNVAEAFREHGWDRETFAAMSDEEIREALTAVTGVGEWTANMQLIFSLGRPDVFPVGDLGIRKGMDALFDREMTRAEMAEAAERWKPYRSYASLYLWRATEGVTEAVTEVDEG